jgi:hypothetical protein
MSPEFLIKTSMCPFVEHVEVVFAQKAAFVSRNGGIAHFIDPSN